MELLELRTLWRWLALGALAVTLLGGAVERALARTAGDPPQASGLFTDEREVLARKRMVDRQLRSRGIVDTRVLDVMGAIRRSLFVPAAQREHAYEDRPLPIGHRQTISQPYIVAVMTELLRLEPGDRVLEVGTGSGYQAAVLSRLAQRVFTIEILAPLAERARGTLHSLGFDNVVVVTGDGYRGLPEEAPFDGILVTAAPAEVPQPLLDQLAQGGRLVIPVGKRQQWLRVYEREEQGIRSERLFRVRFVPMTGRAKRGPQRSR